MKLSLSDFAVLDFETKPIGKRPFHYPPEPVGVAIMTDQMKKYFAWGHSSKNNCTKKEATREIVKVMSRKKMVFHNGPFDIEVALAHHGQKSWPRHWEDTQFLAYLYDPRARELALKPLAQDLLGLVPAERDRLKDWIIANIPEAKRKPSTWGEHIWRAPGDLVGKYAIGDVERTWKLFKFLRPRISDMGMDGAYERELELAPIVVAMEKHGIPVAKKRLERDLLKWEKEHEEIENKIKRSLKVGEDFNIGSSVQLADALDRTGKVTTWELTAKGNRSTKRENLLKYCNDKKLVTLLARYGVLSTYMNTFAEPWLVEAEQTGGLIYPSFNQVRSSDDFNGGGSGTKTGRFSSSRPNFQNIPRDPEDASKPYTIGLPKLRDYIIPPPGRLLIGRDYSQQELRILAHFEDGELLEQYRKDPKMDVHTFVGSLILQNMGIEYPRPKIKTTNFGLIYGMGVDKLAKGTGSTPEEASALKNAVLRALPGVKDLSKELKKMARRDEPLRTWGGRLYWVEEPRMIAGRMKTFEYKMLNLLIQGSAADCTKEAMIRVYDAFGSDAAMMLQVHDELLCTCDKGTERKNMKLLREAMESVEFDLPMLSDGKKGAVSWARMKKWEAAA